MKKQTRNYLGRNLSRKRTSDRLSKKKRSALMSKIHSKKTKFEILFINKLKIATDVDFKTNVKVISGKPDIVFTKNKLCIFLDSDFWHGWQYPRWRHLLKNDFWRKKIENNRKRDKKITRLLKKSDWNVLRLWEHEINQDPISVIKKVKKSL